MGEYLLELKQADAINGPYGIISDAMEIRDGYCFLIFLICYF